MERLRRKERTGLTTDGLRNWGFLFLGLGIFGRGLLQNGMLGMAGENNMDLLLSMMDSSEGMIAATVAVVCQFLESCAAPIFCFLLVEGFLHTSDFSGYMKRVVGLALITEIPYNLAMSGKLLDLGSRNPVFAMVLCLVLLYFYNRYSAKSFVNVLIKLVVTLAAFVWGGMLSIDGASCCVLITAVLWGFRSRPTFRTIMACSATILCSVFSLFYLVAPMSFLAIHFYNGEKGERNRAINYLAYPVMLAAIGIAGVVLF